MAIKRYEANKDNTITDAFKMDLVTRATASNMGSADILETFSIYAQANSASHEASRVLVEFPIDQILTDRSASLLPAPGYVNWKLKLYNAKHSQTVPRNLILNIAAVSQSWDEGRGLDLEEYSDEGACNWITASVEVNANSYNVPTQWSSSGGVYVTSSLDLPSGNGKAWHDYVKNVTLEKGIEDVSIDVTDLVEAWIKYEDVQGVAPASIENRKSNLQNHGALKNYGFGIRITSSQEDDDRSYFTKKFFSRSTEFFYKKPILEALWDSSLSDDSNNFYLSSSLAEGENLNKIYLYNFVRGQLRNIPAIGVGNIGVSIYSGSSDNTSIAQTSNPIGLPQWPSLSHMDATTITGSFVSTGIYSASFAYTSSNITTIFPVWKDLGLTSANTEYHTGSAIKVKTFESLDYVPNAEYYCKITNLKDSYDVKETPRLRLYTREKNWSPTIYTRASEEIENTLIERVYYKVTREADNLTVVSYGTGSNENNFSKLSYDASGSYFDLDMSLFEPGYMYSIKFLLDVGGYKKEQPENFKFRVE
tara:strand:- start:803 stop:2407 length:1605 start_codon:yes stop_codon:yes gene_type:complete